ncbi:hypothetical protein D918_06980 [Trichuris suis]|nr:hypothetical protein D918_06980 [Trichuris suis]
MHDCSKKEEGVQYHPMLMEKRRREKGQASENGKVQVGLVGMPTKGRVLLQTARAVMRTMSGDRTVVMCLLDAGSQRSFITEELANRMRLKGPLEYVEISTLGGQSKYCKRSRRVQFALSALDSREQIGAKQWRTMEALCLPKICSPVQANPLLQRRWKHLHGLKLADRFPRECSKIDVLIGLDYYYDFISQEVRHGHAGEPVALRTLFGWIVCGSIGEGSRVRNVRSLHAQVMEDPNEILRKFWDLEAPGIRDAEEARKSQSTEAIRHYTESITFEGERYVVRLPWKTDVVNLPNNYKQAKGRLFQTERKLSDSRQMSTYIEAMDAYVSNGWVEEVNYDSGQSGKIWNLPHHAVFREDKTTTKCRVVFDGSVRYEGHSLNDHLEPGPALQTDLIGILLRFRRYRFGLQADISKMFMQIGLHEDDRDVTRCLWRNMNTDIPPGIFRFKRLTFGLRSSPFLAIMVVQHHARLHIETYKRAAEEVLSNMYVDDILTSCADSDEAKQLVDQLRKLMQLGGFNLTQWKCNSSSVAEAIGMTDVTGNSDRIVSKILGVPWNLGQDALSFVTPHDVISKHGETKRELLSAVARIFDPLGFLAPFIIRAKIILQLLWQSGCGWDESIPDVLNAKWNRWKQELHMLPQEL